MTEDQIRYYEERLYSRYLATSRALTMVYGHSMSMYVAEVCDRCLYFAKNNKLQDDNSFWMTNTQQQERLGPEFNEKLVRKCKQKCIELGVITVVGFRRVRKGWEAGDAKEFVLINLDRAIELKHAAEDQISRKSTHPKADKTGDFSGCAQTGRPRSPDSGTRTETYTNGEHTHTSYGRTYTRAGAHARGEGNSQEPGPGNPSMENLPSPPLKRTIPPSQSQPAQAKPTKPKVAPIAGFLRFWGLYPKHVAKPHAEKAWCAAIRGGATAKEVIAGLEVQLPDLSTREQKYIPHPGTWLNGKRWLDEPSKPVTNGSGKTNGTKYDAMPTVKEQIYAYVPETAQFREDEIDQMWSIQMRVRKVLGEKSDSPLDRGAAAAAIALLEAIKAERKRCRETVRELYNGGLLSERTVILDYLAWVEEKGFGDKFDIRAFAMDNWMFSKFRHHLRQQMVDNRDPITGTEQHWSNP